MEPHIARPSSPVQLPDRAHGGPTNVQLDCDGSTRITKACEACREKRVRCVGTPPCVRCIKHGRAATCAVRLKARPGRKSTKVNTTTSGAGHDVRSLALVVPVAKGGPSFEVSASPTYTTNDDRAVHAQTMSAWGDRGSVGTESSGPWSGTNAIGASHNAHDIENSQEVDIHARTTRQSVADSGPVMTTRTVVQQDSAERVLDTFVDSSPQRVAPNHDQSQPDPVADPGTAVEKRSPLRLLEDWVTEWSALNGIRSESLFFRPHTLLSDTAGSSLPTEPFLRIFEDLLIDNLLSNTTAPATPPALHGDRQWLLLLYKRYCIIPASLSDDQSALINAVLCVGRFVFIRTAMNDTAGAPLLASDTTREDITYYQMSLRALDRWNRPSLIAIQAYLFLQIFAVGAGSPADTRLIHERLATQITTLKLHQRDAVCLYPPYEQEQAAAYLSAYMHNDHFRAILTDLTPTIPLSQLDIDVESIVASAGSTPSNHRFVCTAQFLAKYEEDNARLFEKESVSQAERDWTSQIRQIRPSTFLREKEINWADFRYNWIRILLHIPRMVGNDCDPTAHAVVVRCISRTFSTYDDLVEIQELNPSWPQVARLVICGQLLLVICEAGELHRREGQAMFAKLVDLLALHQNSWPICGDLISGFLEAASRLGVPAASRGTRDAVQGPLTSPALNERESEPGPLVRDLAVGHQDDFFLGPFGELAWNDLIPEIS